jgi:L-arabinokinase
MGEFLRAISSDADASMTRARAWVKKLARCDCEIEIRSDVPQGKGVASSAAVEIAVARAVAASALRAGVVSEDDAARRFSAHVAMIPLYCQTAENDVVGAPCGFMDQYACFHSVDSASRGNFIAIDCDLANTSHDGAEDIYRLVPLPRKLRVWGIDSGVRHSNSGGSDYARVRCGTFMGKKILINEMNARLNRDVVPSKVDLCGVITARQWDEGSAGSPMSWSQHVDEEMTGKSFLARYISHDDEPNTTIDADSTYTLRATVSHAVREHARVREFLSILEDWPSDDVCADDDVRQLGRRLGDLMFASHSSYSSVGLGSTATDDLVRLVREVDVERNALFGAKITGGGSGGVVCVLGEDSPSARAAIDAVRREYAKKHSLTNLPDLLHASHVTDVD